MGERKNAGYMIIQSMMVGNAEFVLGYREGAMTPYVTWECKDGNNYFWGHYFMERHQAVRDLLERCNLELIAQDRIRENRKKREECER